MIDQHARPTASTSRGLFSGIVWRPLALALMVALISLGAAAAPAPRPSGLTSTPGPYFGYAWTQIGVNGAQIARVVTNRGCPVLTTDGVARPMSPRADAGNGHADTVCEAEIPAGTSAASLSVSGGPIPLLSGQPKRIAVIGDTGCRLKTEDGFQACNDPAAWPFAAIAAQVAAWKPDLIIHVGDYLYREEACPAGNAGCAGSPYGDTWATWQADFFQPANPLLAAAPILFLRGNHEICERAGNGWFRYLDPRPMPATCQQYTDPYAVPLGDLQLLVLDSAEAGDAKSSPEETAAYEAQFAAIAKLAGDNAWFVSHKALVGVLENKQGSQFEVHTGSFQEATGSVVPPGVKLAIAGHIHAAEVLTFDAESGRPPQLIAGNGGTALDRNVTADLTAGEFADQGLAAGQTIAQFGFVTLERTDAEWVATERDMHGQAGTTCTLGDGTATCVFAPGS